MWSLIALVAIQKCLVLLHDYIGPNTKEQWLHTVHTHTNRFNLPIAFKCSFSMIDEVNVINKEDRNQQEGSYMNTPEKYGNLEK